MQGAGSNGSLHAPLAQLDVERVREQLQLTAPQLLGCDPPSHCVRRRAGPYTRPRRCGSSNEHRS